MTILNSDTSEPVIEMGLCEIEHVMLRPNQLYRFIVMPNCDRCKSLNVYSPNSQLPRSAKCCALCKHWQIFDVKTRLGDCLGAIERAREIVSFAVNLDVSKVYGYGGSKCPDFEHFLSQEKD